MPRIVALHKLDPTRPPKNHGTTQPTMCRTRSREPLVFDQRNAAEVVARAIPDGYRLCGKCWPEEERE